MSYQIHIGLRYDAQGDVVGVNEERALYFGTAIERAKDASGERHEVRIYGPGGRLAVIVRAREIYAIDLTAPEQTILAVGHVGAP